VIIFGVRGRAGQTDWAGCVRAALDENLADDALAPTR